MAQSTNDVIPTAMRLATLATLPALLSALSALSTALLAKGKEFDHVIKSGRTHLQDATPIRLGQEFTAYGHTVERHRAKAVRGPPTGCAIWASAGPRWAPASTPNRSIPG